MFRNHTPCPDEEEKLMTLWQGCAPLIRHHREGFERGLKVRRSLQGGRIDAGGQTPHPVVNSRPSIRKTAKAMHP
jgi:hypothetical protein